ncbi:MAG: hypothetical protein EZS28_018568 [Streblomastix strix]|uniref:Uncharacterized protein n=1 Tax=Streblomastix strix TaxID=222440 RepID=A0A5J4VTH4_9EUKA|nr:MAG: hypothetical protein EZS28_018568 [Streblomastix strix]
MASKIWQQFELFIYSLQFTSVILYFLSLEKNIIWLRYLTKTTPVLLLLPLVHIVWRKQIGAKNTASLFLLTFYTIGILLSAIGDLLLVRDIWESSYTFGASSFILGLLCYAVAFYPKKEGYQTRVFIQSFIIMTVISSCVFLIIFRGVYNSPVNIVTCFIYLLTQCIIVTSFVSQPNNSQDRCEQCQSVGSCGAILFCLSDFMLIIDAGLKMIEQNNGRDGTIPGFPLRNYAVMLTYYAGQFMIAWCTRQWSCAERNKVKEQIVVELKMSKQEHEKELRKSE